MRAVSAAACAEDCRARGEREVAAIFRAAGFDCERVPNSGGLRLKGDLYGDLPLHVECKRRATWSIPYASVRQAQLEADGRPFMLAFRADGGQWWSVMPLAQAVGMLA